jgi:hypothetical protein
MWHFQSSPVQQDTQPSIQESNSHTLPPLTLHQRTLAYAADNIQLQVYARGFSTPLRTQLAYQIYHHWHYCSYSKSSLTLTLNEWRFNLSFSCVSILFWIAGWLVSYVPYYVSTHPPAIQKQHWHLREAQIEPPPIECECEWAFRIEGYMWTG